MKLRAIGRRRAASGGITVVAPGKAIRIAEIDPDGAPGGSKRKGERRAEKLRARLRELQEVLYAEHKRSLLIVLQGMDTGGKDGAIEKICSGLNPNGVHVTNFRSPSTEEWDHDFLWRIHHTAPPKGIIGIWNRSHYEDLLVPRVHDLVSEVIWRERCEDINAFERLLSHNGVTWLKFFLHISKEEQKERLEARLQDPNKFWKFNPNDLKERARWGKYQDAYEAVVNACSTKIAPWHIVPANRKWARNLTMLETIVTTLERMNPKYPAASFDPKTIVIK